jgi:di/tricarboxylate transporter
VAPAPVVALLPICIFSLLGIATLKATALAYFNHITFLYLGAMLVNVAIERSGLHRRFALKILLAIPSERAKYTLLAFMLVTALLSMICSNTATTIMLTPFVLGILQTAEEKYGDDVTMLAAAKRFGVSVERSCCISLFIFFRGAIIHFTNRLHIVFTERRFIRDCVHKQCSWNGDPHRLANKYDRRWHVWRNIL